MKSETVSRHPSPLTAPAPAPVPVAAGACATEEDAPDEDDGSDPSPAMLSRLSFCIAWLFGLEAFLSGPDARPQTPRG